MPEKRLDVLIAEEHVSEVRRWPSAPLPDADR